jgi:hypothetical protein
MASTAQRILRTAEITIIICFAAFALLCWASSGKLEPWKPITIYATLSAWVLTLVCSVAVWRSYRWLAVLGVFVAIFWMIWALMPRL